MENKLIINGVEDFDIQYHPNIKGVQIIEGKNNFPISWLNTQGYCEYSLYLEYFKGITTGPTQAMTTGTEEHNKLEEKFKETAQVASYVDPRIGSEGLGRTFIGPCVPFGMIKPGPDCGTSNNAGWAPMPSLVSGFSQTHVSGTGGGPKYGNVLIQGRTDENGPSPHPRRAVRLHFSSGGKSCAATTPAPVPARSRMTTSPIRIGAFGRTRFSAAAHSRMRSFGTGRSVRTAKGLSQPSARMIPVRTRMGATASCTAYACPFSHPFPSTESTLPSSASTKTVQPFGQQMQVRLLFMPISPL